MNKQYFLDGLRLKLAGFPKEEVSERLDFYSEMIDDRIEEGLSEEDAVADIGTVEDIAAQIIADIPLKKIAKERIRSRRRLSAIEIVLLVLGSPIWISLIVAAFAVILSVYAVLWSVIISLWAVFVSLAASSLGGIVAGVVFSIFTSAPVGAAMVGGGILCAGLSILMFFGCRAATKGILALTKKIALGVKKCFVRKERE